MKKILCILVAVAITAILSASCYKTCQCKLYHKDGTTTTITQTNPHPSKKCNILDVKVVVDSVTTGIECK